MDGLFNFLSKLKVPTKIVFGALLIVSGLILFLPQKILALLGLNNLTEQHRTIIGITFLLSLSVLLLFLLGLIKDIFLIKRKCRNRKKYLISILNNTSSDEYDLLYNMYRKHMAIIVPNNTKSALYLQTNGIISAPPQNTFLYYDGTMPVKYIVQPWAANIIEKHFKKQVNKQ